jgi:hypothetical protein
MSQQGQAMFAVLLLQAQEGGLEQIKTPTAQTQTQSRARERRTSCYAALDALDAVAA